MFRNIAVLTGEHSLGFLPTLNQEVIILKYGSRQSPMASPKCDVPLSEDLYICLHHDDDDPLAELLAPDVGAVEECSADGDTAALKASAALCLDAVDSGGGNHCGTLEAMVHSTKGSVSAESGTELYRKAASALKERVYSVGNDILLERQAKYACHLCPYMTKSKSSMIAHRRQHKGIKNHKCTVCDRSFQQRSTLLYHLRTHTGERPYSCSMCSGTFACKSTLTGHERTHTGERPYRCDMCDQAFAGLSSLRCHKRKHAGGGDPYVCPMCPATFVKQGMLNDHISRQHAASEYLPG